MTKRALAALLLAAAAPAPPPRPVVVEMFTSLACSSCPPADALLTSLAKNPQILALSLNINYWNNLGWTDPYGLQDATVRQAWYAGLANSQTVFTPEAVVDGTAQLVGSNGGAIAAAIAAAQANPAGNIPITIKDGKMLTIAVGTGPLNSNADIYLLGYDSQHTTTIGGGENGGETLTETNIVRSISNLGPWTGQTMSMSFSRPAGQHMAVLLQTPTGAVLGAASE